MIHPLFINGENLTLPIYFNVNILMKRYASHFVMASMPVTMLQSCHQHGGYCLTTAYPKSENTLIRNHQLGLPKEIMCESVLKMVIAWNPHR